MIMNRLAFVVAFVALVLWRSEATSSSTAFVSIRLRQPGSHVHTIRRQQRQRAVYDDNSNNENSSSSENEAERLRQRAEELREQIRKMEEEMGDRRSNTKFYRESNSEDVTTMDSGNGDMTLRNKRVLVVGANGRLGSMVCRHLLRNHPSTKVTAAVHTVGVDSPTARGYARLSYEVGAEDGIGSIGPAWSEEERTATFQFSPEMKAYNLQNLRVVECELLDPVQCATITENVDAIIWCATDFNDNTPRAISGLNLAFLVRAIANPTKGRVEIEGLRNILGGLYRSKQDRKWKSPQAQSSIQRGYTPPSTSTTTTSTTSNDPISFVMVSTAPDAFDDFETPMGSFHAIKREGEKLLQEEFPSLTHSILRFGRFEDFFVREGLDIQRSTTTTTDGGVVDEEEGGDSNRPQQRYIHRRDAARVAVETLTNRDLLDKTTEVWTIEK